MFQAFAYFLFAGSGEVLFGLVGQSFDNFVCVPTGSSFLGPNGCSEGDAFREEFLFYDPPVLPQLSVGVVLNGVSLGLVCLRCDANVDGDAAPVENGVSDDVSWSESGRVAEGLLSGRGGVNSFGDCCDGTHDAVVSSSGLCGRAAACVCATNVKELATTMACGCFW